MITGFSPYVRKTLTAFVLGGLVWAFQARGQGTFALNTATGSSPRITLDGVNVSSADNVFVQIVASGATSISGAGAAPFGLTLAGANAGSFSRRVLTFNGNCHPSGLACQIQDTVTESLPNRPIPPISPDWSATTPCLKNPNLADTNELV